MCVREHVSLCIINRDAYIKVSPLPYARLLFMDSNPSDHSFRPYLPSPEKKSSLP
jgi:hypothetical protein